MGPLARLRDTAAFLRARPAALLVVVTGALAGAATGVPTGGVAFDYLWRDPQFCGTCHVHDYANEAWARSPHATLTTCHDCHRVPIRHYPHNLILAVFDRPQTPEEVRSADVATVLCEQCHSDRGAEEPLSGPMPDDLRVAVPKVDHSPLHRVHLDAPDRRPERYHGGSPEDVESGPMVCLDCHGGRDLEVHTFTADARDCIACHRGMDPTDERGAALSCLDCHAAGFVAGQPHP